MDTVTQGLLGGAIGALVYRKTSPRKGLLLGATVGILPDLDIFIPQPDAIATMTDHRSWSHSWIIQTLLSPLLAYLITLIDRQHRFKQVLLLVWLALVTHSGLDALTVYGTQLFWPFMPHPASGGSIFIIDPVYTVPLVLGALFILIVPQWSCSKALMKFSFIFSCAYLIWGLAMQSVINSQVEHQFKIDNINYQHTQVSATAFNTLLWRILVITDDHYYEGFRSVFDSSDTIQLHCFDRGTELSQKLENNPHYKRMKWFTHDRFKLSMEENEIVLSDLRMGKEPHYFFRFAIADENGNLIEYPDRVSADFDRRAALKSLWQRIWQEPVH